MEGNDPAHREINDNNSSQDKPNQYYEKMRNTDSSSPSKFATHVESELVNDPSESSSLDTGKPGSNQGEELQHNFNVYEEEEDNFLLTNDRRPDDESHTIEFEGELIFVGANSWKGSTLIKFQIFTAIFAFVLFGLAEQTISTLIPKFQSHYDIDDVQISFIFLASVLGYFTMAILNENTHNRLGVRGVTIFGCASMTTCYLIISTKPPYWVVVLCYVLNGFGFGSIDASMNLWSATLQNASPILGAIHGAYGLGCLISPPLITHLLEREKNPWAWNQYYILLSGVGSFCLVSFIFSFKNETATKYRYIMFNKFKDQQRSNQIHENNDIELNQIKNNPEISIDDEDEEILMDSDFGKISMKEILSSKLIWYLCLILFIYVGGEVGFGSWAITYLMRIKSFSYKHASYMATSFWAGLTIGRICLGFATDYYFKNELTANLTYIIWSLIGFLVFWLLCLIPLSIYYLLFLIVFISGVGVGPVFPTTIVASVQILPIKYHASGVGLICSIGGSGSGLITWIIGIQFKSGELGTKLFPLTIFSLFLFLTFLWIGLMGRYGTNYGINKI